MNTEIEQKILEMRFDNKQFESNVSESISTLGKLKQALSFDKIGENFEAVTRAAGRVDFSPITSGVESVVVKFNALEFAAIQVFSNIITNGINRLQSAINSLSTDQIRAGWGKYEEKTNSVQTIMAATGKTIEEVSSQLERLNWFSDETSYSFTDMTSNVGKFTSVGVDLEKAVSAMEGISTWAALSGANSQTAARAMYNLSQAMGVGVVKLMDWRSIENAGMATTEFKQTVLDTAVAVGTLTKGVDGLYKTTKGTEVTVENFSSTLAEGWFNADALIKSLDVYGGYANALSIACEETGLSATKMDKAFIDWMTNAKPFDDICKEAGVSADVLRVGLDELSVTEWEMGHKAFLAAQQAKTFTDALDATKDAVSTGWMKTFEILLGNFEQASEFFTEVTGYLWELFAASGEVRNEILKSWADLGGGDIFRDSILNILESAQNIVEYIRRIIFQITGIWDSEGRLQQSFVLKLVDFTRKFAGWTDKLVEFTSKIQLTGKSIVGLKNMFNGITDAFGMIFDAFTAVKPLFDWLFDILLKISTYLMENVLSNFGKGLTMLRQYISENRIFESLVERVGRVASKAWEMIKVALQPISDLLSPVISKLQQFFSFHTRSDYFKFFDNIREKLTNIFDIDIDDEKIWRVVLNIRNALYDIIGFLTNIFSQVRQFIAQTNLDEFFGKVWETLKSIGSGILDFLGNFKITKVFREILDGISNISESVFTFLGKINLSEILSKVKSFGGNVVSVFSQMFSGIKSAFKNFNLQNTLSTLSEGFGQLDISKIFQNLTKGVMLFGGFNLGKLFGSASNGIDALANLAKEGGGIGGFFKSLMSPVTDVFDQLKETIGSFTRDTDGEKLKSIAIAIGILTAALVVLSGIDQDKMNTALTGLAGILGGLFLEMKGLSKIDLSGGKQFKNIGLTMMEIAAAMFIVMEAVKPFADMKWEELAKAGAAMTVILGEFLGFIAVFGAIARANQIGNTESKGIFGLFQKSNGFDKQMKNVAVAMIELGAAMKVFASAAKDFSVNDKLGQSIGAMTVIMVEMAAFIFAASKLNTKGISSVAFAMIELGAAMKIFASAMSEFSQINGHDGADMIHAIAAFTAVMAEMVLFITAADNVSSSSGKILVIASSMIVLGAAFKIFASAMDDFAQLKPTEWLNALSQMGAVFTGMLVFIGIAAMAASSAPQILITSAAMVVLGAAMKVIASAAKDFEGVDPDQFGKLSLALVGFLAAVTALAAVDTIAGPGLVTLGTGLLMIAGALTLFGVALTSINIGLFTARLADFGQRLVWVGDNLLGYISKLNASAGADAFIKILESIVTAIPKAVAGIVAGLISGLGDILASLGDLFAGLKAAVLSFLDLVGELAPEVIDTFLTIILETLSSIVDKAPQIITTLFDLIIKLLDGLVTYIPQIVEKVAAIFVKIFDSLTTHIPEMLTSFMNFVSELFGQILSVVQGTNQDTLLKLAEMFGGLVAVIVVLDLIKSMIPGAMAGLLAISAFIAELGLIIAAFGALNSIPGFQWLVEKGGDLLEAIGVAIGKFIGGIAGGLLEGATSTLPKVGKNIADFWTNIQPFIDGVSRIDMETVAKVGILTASIIALTAADFLGGIADFMRDALNIQGFGVSITNMWKNIQPFIEGVKGLSPKVVTAVETLSKAILILTASQLVDSIASFIVGSNDIDKFGVSISKLGPYLKTFSDSVKDIDNRAVKVASEAIGILVEAFDRDVFKTGGLKQAIFGENSNLVKFGEGLVALGPSIKAYAKSVSGLDTNVIENSIRGANALSEMASKLPKKGGVVGQLKGNSDLVDFAAGLAALGPKLKAYGDSVKDLDIAVVENSIKAAKAISGFASNLEDVTIFDKWLKKDKMQEFTSSLKELGEGLKKYYDDIKSINVEHMSAAITAVTDMMSLFSEENNFSFKIDEKFTEAMHNAAVNGIDAFTAVFTESFEKIETTGSDLIDSVINGMDEKHESFIDWIKTTLDDFLKAIRDKFSSVKIHGSNLITALINGMNLKLTSATDTMKNIVSKILEKITDSNVLTSFEDAGTELIRKVSFGISNMMSRVLNTTTTIVDQALGCFTNDNILQNFADAGSDLIQKFIDAMSDMKARVAEIAREVADEAYAKIRDAIAGLESELHPVITPIIDLSSYYEELRRIQDELNNPRSDNSNPYDDFGNYSSVMAGSIASGYNSYSNNYNTNNNSAVINMSNNITYNGDYRDVGVFAREIDKVIGNSVSNAIASRGYKSINMIN